MYLTVKIVFKITKKIPTITNTTTIISNTEGNTPDN